MDSLGQAFLAALELIGRGDGDLYAIILLSLQVSVTATVIAFSLGAPVGVVSAVAHFPGRGALLVLVNALLGLPPVLVGLIVYVLVSRAGPFGFLGLLFTPSAMVAAQVILTLPIVVALAHRIAEPLWQDYGDTFVMYGSSPLRTVGTLMAMARGALVTVYLAAFGRAIAEVGAIIIVGGNIRGYTRTMTTAIALETSKGELALGIALGLILVTLSIVVSATAFILNRMASAR